MRKISKIPKMAIGPRQIIRFDHDDLSPLLYNPTNHKTIHLHKKTLHKHANILQLSAAQANTVCLATNQIGF